MDVFEDICEIARARPQRIVLAEGEDPRVIEAARRASRERIARPILLGDPEVIGVGPGDGLEVVSPGRSPHLEAYAQAYQVLRQGRGLTIEAAREEMQGSLGFAAMMVRQGHADGTLAGAVATTAETVRAALRILGRAPDASLVSSCFLMLLKEPFERPVIFADCGLVPQPDAEQLASIALASADTLAALTGLEPKIAMLSFSTLGSAAPEVHESINRIRQAVSIVQSRRPDLMIEGELQFDAAIVPEVAVAKAKGSGLAGNANVFVFPSLSAGNIGYKIAQRIGGATALGPVLQGLAHPANDLSRGCSAEDVFQMIAITGAQAAAQSAVQAA